MAKAPNRKHKPENCFRLSPNCHCPSIDPQLPIRLPLDSFHPCPNYETAATRGEVLPPVSETGGDHLGSFAPPAGRRPDAVGGGHLRLNECNIVARGC